MSNRLKISTLVPFTEFPSNERPHKYCIFMSSLEERLNLRLKKRDEYVLNIDDGEKITCVEAYKHLQEIISGDLVHWRIMTKKERTGYLYDLLEENQDKCLTVSLLNTIEKKLTQAINYADVKEYRIVHPVWYCKVLYKITEGVIKEGEFKQHLIEDTKLRSLQDVDMNPEHVKEELGLIKDDFQALVANHNLPKEPDYEYLNNFLHRWTMNVDKDLIQNWQSQLEPIKS